MEDDEKDLETIKKVLDKRGIRDVVVNKTDDQIQSVRVIFGPHYYVDIAVKNKEVTFKLGATHHGFTAEATNINGKLEKIINEVRNIFPETIHD